jgi:valyl-tRNA synthetase
MFSTEKCDFGRNFANKIWNAGRFLLMNAQSIQLNYELLDKHVDFSDLWIQSRFNQTLKELNKAMENFEVNNASKIIYSYVWNDFCDWFIELSKNRFYAKDEEVKSAALIRALSYFENLLKIVHPFMPFITEELFHLIKERKQGESILISDYPSVDESTINISAEKEMEFVQNIITAIRNIRGEMNIPPSKALNVFIKTSEVRAHQVEYIKKLARVENLTADPALEKPGASASAVIKDCEIFIPLEGLIDLDVERNRIRKEIERTEVSLVSINKKLSNEKFVQNAAPDIVEKEKRKKYEWELNLEKLKKILINLG